MAVWTVTATLEQALVILFGVLATAAVAGALAAILGSLTIRALLPSVDHRIDEAWAAIVAPLSTFGDRFPPTSVNPTASRLEAVAAELGITLASAAGPERPVPTREAAAAFAAVAGELSELERFRPVDDLDTAVPGLRQWRADRRTQIAEAIGVMQDGDPPVWDSDLERSPEGPAIDLAGHLQLQRVLIAEAWMAFQDGDPDAANRALEASWRLNGILLDCPQLDIHVAAMSVLELQTAVLRRIPGLDRHWQDRLRSLDPPAHARRGYLCLTWQVRKRAEMMLADRGRAVGFLVRPVARLLATHHHRAMQRAVAELEVRDIVGFDSGSFAAAQLARVPRWDQLSRPAMPSSWTSWSDSVRCGLVAELTRRVIRVRELYGGGGMAALAELQPAQPSRVDGLDWRYTVGDDRVAIELTPDPFPDRGMFPLRADIELGPAEQAPAGGGL